MKLYTSSWAGEIITEALVSRSTVETLGFPETHIEEGYRQKLIIVTQS